MYTWHIKCIWILFDGVCPFIPANAILSFVACLRQTRQRKSKQVAYKDASRASLKQAGYSSVGRASDCRLLQPSDGHWFDSGWPDFITGPSM